MKNARASMFAMIVWRLKSVLRFWLASSLMAPDAFVKIKIICPRPMQRKLPRIIWSSVKRMAVARPVAPAKKKLRSVR